MFKFMNWQQRMLMDKAGDPAGGGGNPATQPNPEMDELKKTNATLLARLEALEKSNNPNPGGDPTLAEKAKKEAEEKAKNESQNKKIESALKFSLQANEWIKVNSELLPKTIQGIFDQANKENYESPVEKDSAIKANIISEFFSVQENLDLLTAAQKSSLETFNKLTKNAKQDRAQDIYDQVFEPTFEMLKRVKKAEMLSKGVATPSDVNKAYHQRLQEKSRKFFLKEK